MRLDDTLSALTIRNAHEEYAIGRAYRVRKIPPRHTATCSRTGRGRDAEAVDDDPDEEIIARPVRCDAYLRVP